MLLGDSLPLLPDAALKEPKDVIKPMLHELMGHHAPFWSCFQVQQAAFDQQWREYCTRQSLKLLQLREQRRHLPRAQRSAAQPNYVLAPGQPDAHQDAAGMHLDCVLLQVMCSVASWTLCCGDTATRMCISASIMHPITFCPHSSII